MATILLAEDDDNLREFLAQSLERADHLVTAVADGLEGASALEDGGFDVLVADVVMPGLDGIELARKARSQCPGIRVVFITGFAAVAVTARNEGPPGSRVLSKPFHLRTLVSEVGRLLVA